MFKLDSKIQELLYQYDCVVIPEFGGFVANYKPSQIKKDTHFIYPPSKVLSFNKNLRANDGLLAKHISQKKAITFEEANQEIKEIVEDYFTQLNNGQRIEFEKVGILYFDKYKNILFDPFNNCNFLLDSFGLEAFFAPKNKKLNKLTEIKEFFSKEDNKNILEQNSLVKPVFADNKNEKIISISRDPLPAKRQGKWKKYAVAAISLSIVFYAGIVSYKTGFRNPKYIFTAELNPLREKTKHKYFSRPVYVYDSKNDQSIFEDTADISLAGIFFDTISEDTNAENKESALNIEALKNVNGDTNESGKYFVVGGCFSNFDNAKNYYSTLEKKGFNAEILERHKGLYPVVYGSYVTKRDAEIAQVEITKTDGNKAWILKR